MSTLFGAVAAAVCATEQGPCARDQALRVGSFADAWGTGGAGRDRNMQYNTTVAIGR
jgi:hypothetical protein